MKVTVVAKRAEIPAGEEGRVLVLVVQRPGEAARELRGVSPRTWEDAKLGAEIEVTSW
jgi:hypothetical protein